MKTKKNCDLKKKTLWTPFKGELKDSLIAVMDIMGFSSVLKNNSFSFDMLVTNMAVDACLKRVKHRALYSYKKDLSYIKKIPNSILHFQFSDTLIFIMPNLEKSVREAEIQFIMFVEAVKWAVNTFFDQGFPVQCQMEYGNCWWNMDENFLLGKPFVIAHEKADAMGFSGVVISEDVLKVVFGNVMGEACRKFCRWIGIEKISVPDKADNYNPAYCVDWFHIRNDSDFNICSIRQRLIEKFTNHGKSLTPSVVKKIDNTENLIHQFYARAKEYQEEEGCYKQSTEVTEFVQQCEIEAKCKRKTCRKLRRK